MKLKELVVEWYSITRFFLPAKFLSQELSALQDVKAYQKFYHDYQSFGYIQAIYMS